jgi:hypothetical protein
VSAFASREAEASGTPIILRSLVTLGMVALPKYQRVFQLNADAAPEEIGVHTSCSTASPISISRVKTVLVGFADS